MYNNPDNNVTGIIIIRFYNSQVHPDKNQDNKERAQLAFEAVNKAWKTVEDEKLRKRCLDIYEEAKDRTDHMVISSYHIRSFPMFTL